MRIITLAILILTASALWADAVPRLETATGELEAIVADLESAQAQSEELRDKLASLESLSPSTRPPYSPKTSFWLSTEPQWPNSKPTIGLRSTWRRT